MGSMHLIMSFHDDLGVFLLNANYGAREDVDNRIGCDTDLG